MSLSNAMFASVSGLDTASTAISVIGDNIANVSTPGFKERRAEFSDVLGRSISTGGGFAQTGSGSRVANVSQVFTQGSFETTGRETDLAIEGGGFFILRSSEGQFYSRAGMFDFDENGTLIDSNANRVQGFGIDPSTLQPNGQLGDITVDTSLASPQNTSTLDFSLNLDANAPTVGPFDASAPFATSNFQTVINVFDSLGNAHPATAYFTKTATNSWDWNVALPTADTTLPPASPGDSIVVQGGGTLAFDSAGLLTGATGTAATFEFAGGGTASQPIAIGFGPTGPGASGNTTTQFSNSQSSINSQTQDGFGPGTLQAISIDSEGYFNASFSNGVVRPIAQVALATFPSTSGLESVGNNAFQESRNSGQPLIGGAGSGQFGAIRSASVEQSNVDLAAQFIRLILNQRAFQANTRTVSTTNELLANLVQLGQ